MPLYEYTCEKCAHHFEVLVRGTEAAECPKCGSVKVRKEWSVPAAHVAGGSGSQLPIAGSMSAGMTGGMCGRSECGRGGCQGFGM